MTYLVGIDGGGSTVRVAVTDFDLVVCADSRGDTVNPSVIGREAAAQRIRQTVQAALKMANLTAADIAGVGIGVAGAADTHSSGWLVEVMGGVLPDTVVAPSSDMGIALVGAHGKREGILVLAGTGSVAYGINQAGDSAQAGGWGYLLGDEGSGYWIGLQAIKAVIRAADGYRDSDAFTHHILTTWGLEHPRDLIRWVYHTQTPRTRDIAALTPFVIAQAEADNPLAVSIIDEAAQELARMAQAVIQRLHMDSPAIAFAGGLLEQPNSLSNRLCTRLGLPGIPTPRYPPVIGAALLAKITLERKDTSC